MKKVLSGIAVVVALSGILLAGCKFNNDQIKTMSYQAGRYATLGWFVIDNPSVEVKTIIKQVVEVIKETSAIPEYDKSYSEVLLPIITSTIVPTVPDHLKMVVIAGSVSILAGLDMLFASNPEWKENTKFSILVISSFCNGVDSSLDLTGDDPVLRAALSASVARMQLKK